MQFSAFNPVILNDLFTAGYKYLNKTWRPDSERLAFLRRPILSLPNFYLEEPKKPIILPKIQQDAAPENQTSPRDGPLTPPSKPKPQKTFFFKHTTPKAKTPKKEAFRLSDFSIVNGETGILAGEDLIINLKGEVLQETEIDRMDMRVKFGPFSVFGENSDLGVSHMRIKEGDFDTTITRALGETVRASPFWVRVIVKLYDKEGTMNAHYWMKLKVSSRWV